MKDELNISWTKIKTQNLVPDEDPPRPPPKPPPKPPPEGEED